MGLDPSVRSFETPTGALAGEDHESLAAFLAEDARHYYDPRESSGFGSDGPGRGLDQSRDNSNGDHDDRLGTGGHCSPIPEPPTATALLGLMALGLAMLRRRLASQPAESRRRAGGHGAVAGGD